MSKNTAPVNATGLPKSRRSVLRGVAAVPLATLPAIVPDTVSAAFHPDARLLALGAELDRQEIALKSLRDAYNHPDATPDQDAAYEAADEVQNQTTLLILDEPASTAEGYGVKARAFDYLYHGKLENSSLYPDQGTTDQLLAWSILSGLLAIGGAA